MSAISTLSSRQIKIAAHYLRIARSAAVSEIDAAISHQRPLETIALMWHSLDVSLHEVMLEAVGSRQHDGTLNPMLLT
jgi:hypothetical protein